MLYLFTRDIKKDLTLFTASHIWFSGFTSSVHFVSLCISHFCLFVTLKESPVLFLVLAFLHIEEKWRIFLIVFISKLKSRPGCYSPSRMHAKVVLCLLWHTKNRLGRLLKVCVALHFIVIDLHGQALLKSFQRNRFHCLLKKEKIFIHLRIKSVSCENCKKSWRKFFWFILSLH